VKEGIFETESRIQGEIPTQMYDSNKEYYGFSNYGNEGLREHIYCERSFS